MRTDIVIPHYGEDSYKDRLLESLKTEYLLNLFVIDNNIVNRGFTWAVNAGIRKSQSEFIWILNNDAVVTPGALLALEKRMDENSKCGIVTSKICEFENPDRIVFGGALNVLPGIHKAGWESAGDLAKPTRERWVTFCSVLLRQKMIREIGLLDENFWLICSDSDYCFTARHRCWEIWYEPTSKVLHPEKHGISRVVSETRDEKFMAIMADDQRKFIEKWTGGRFKDLELERFED